LIVRDLKKYTANTILKAIINNDRESKREWMLWMFERMGKRNASNDKYQFWQNGYHPVELNNITMVEQRLNYVHDNPVRAGFVLSPEDFTYSSARNYSNKRDCVMEVEYL
jgi:putative transposase